MSIKVFELNDTEWYAGESLEACIDYYFKEVLGEEDTPEAREDYLDEPCEVSEEAMNRMQFHDLDGGDETVRSFREQLDLLIAGGQEFPMMFATTEY